MLARWGCALCPGDVNEDLIVSPGDLAVLLARFGTVGSPDTTQGDLDGDHDVDLSDPSMLLSNFGMLCS